MTHDAFHQTIRSQRDLERLWGHLMGPLGFSRRSLWLLRIGGDDRALPAITQIDDVPHRFEGRAADGLIDVLTLLDSSSDTPARWGFLLSRPGTGGADAEDRAWVAALARACRDAGVRHDVVHLATDDALVPIPLDALPHTAGRAAS